MAMLKRAEVLKRVGVSWATLWEMMGRGEFPAPRKVGEQAVRWDETEVAAWLAARPRQEYRQKPGRPKKATSLDKVSARAVAVLDRHREYQVKGRRRVRLLPDALRLAAAEIEAGGS